MIGFYRSFISNSVFANVILMLIVVLGLIATVSITKESEPELSLPWFDVTVIYPGADPEEVEEGVTRKVEAAIDGMYGIKSYTSTSREGRSNVRIEVSDGVEASDVGERVRNAVNAIDTFPESADRPVVNRVLEQEEVNALTVWGDVSERQLKVLGEEIRNELQADPLISEVYLYYARPYEIAVEVPSRALEEHNLQLSDISEAIRRSSLNASAGELQLEGEQIRLRTLAKKYTGEELEDVVVRATTSGEMLKLGQIATITDGFNEYEQYTSYNGHPALLIEVNKIIGEDALEIAAAVQRYLAKKRPQLPEGVHISVFFDQTEFIRSQLGLMTKNGLIGLGFVLIVLCLFLEARLAFWVAMGIPISLFGGIVLLWLIGGSLNQISSVAMIVVMGIIVDDAIVAGEAVFVHRRMGKDPITAAVDGMREVALPIFASVIATITAFMPMMFIPGPFGQFTKQMPIVVITALVVSLVECIFLLPAHLKHRSHQDKDYEGRTLSPVRLQRRVARGLETFVIKIYGPTVDLAVRFRYLTMCLGASLIIITLGAIGGGIIKVQMWPSVEGDSLRAFIEYAPGTQTDVLRDGVKQVEEAARRVNERVKTKTGEPLINSIYSTAPYQIDTQGRVDINLASSGTRGIRIAELKALWDEEIGQLPGVLVQSIEGDSIGAGGDHDILFWLQGRDFGELRAASEMLKEKLSRYDGVFQISDNFRPGKSELHIVPRDTATALGLTTEDISRQLYAKYFGEEALHLQRGREDVEVRVRLPRDERETLDSLASIRIRTPKGHDVPLFSLADVSFREGVSEISSLNGVRGVQVQAMVDRAVAVSSEINKDLMDNFMDTITAKHPGVMWSISGVAEQNQQLVETLTRNTLMCMLAIFIILATIFRSYIQPVIIMVIIPFGLVGAAFAHYLLGMPLSFLSFGGIIALAGVLVNDSIVLIERINSNLAKGMPLHESVCQGGQRRFRAIFLTSVSTCAGLAPLIFETDLNAQIVIPMAVALAGGVACGTMLTLVIVPAFLVIMNDARRTVSFLRYRRWPTPEEVEPATRRGKEHAVGADGQPADILTAK